MDVFGLGTLIEKIEQYFGRRICGALLILLTLTAVIACIHFIYQLAVEPLASWLSGTKVTFRDFADRAVPALVLGVLGGALTSVVARFAAKRLLQKVEAHSEASTAALKEARAILDVVEELRTEAREVLGEVRAVIEEAEESDILDETGGGAAGVKP